MQVKTVDLIRKSCIFQLYFCFLLCVGIKIILYLYTAFAKVKYAF